MLKVSPQIDSSGNSDRTERRDSSVGTRNSTGGFQQKRPDRGAFDDGVGSTTVEHTLVMTQLRLSCTKQ